MMNLTDLLIIYLACGAPFGVYYFLQYRRGKQLNLFWIKTFLTFLLWFPFAIRLLWNKFNSDRFYFLKIKEERTLFSTQKQIEAIMLETDSQISIYNFREIFERYIGLSLMIHDGNSKPTESEKEIFRISKKSDIELAAICQHRRNRKRLFFHHNSARQDFLNVVGKISGSIADKKKLGILTIEFVKLLNDLEAEKMLKKLFQSASQTAKEFAVQNSEKDLWNPEIPKPLSINQVSTQFQTMTTTTNSPYKD